MDLNKDTLVLPNWDDIFFVGCLKIPEAVSLAHSLQYLAVPQLLNWDASHTLLQFTKLKEIAYCASTADDFMAVGLPTSNGAMQTWQANVQLLPANHPGQATFQSMLNTWNAIFMQPGPPSEHAILQRMTDTARRNNVVDFKLPKIEYLSKAEFHEQFGAWLHWFWGSWWSDGFYGLIFIWFGMLFRRRGAQHSWGIYNPSGGCPICVGWGNAFCVSSLLIAQHSWDLLEHRSSTSQCQQ